MAPYFYLMAKQLIKILPVVFLCLSLTTVFGQSFQKTDSLEIALTLVKNTEDKIDILLELADEYSNNNPEKALEHAQNAYKISEESDNPKQLVQAMVRLGMIYWSITDFKASMEWATKAKNEAEVLHLPEEQALALRVIGLIYIELSDYEKSSEYFFNSLKIFESIDNKKGILKLLSDIGSVNFHQNNYDKALEYYFRSLNMAKEIDDKKGIARALNNIAAVYEAMNDYEKAGNYFLEASEINKALGNRLWEGINYMNLGTININLKEYETSLNYLKQAITIFEELQSRILQARCQIGFARLYYETGNLDESLQYARKALEEGKKQGLKQIVHDAAGIIRDIYVEQGDKKDAYDYLLLQYQMKDSLIMMENKAELTKLELQYEFDKKEQIRQIELQRRNLFILIIIISLLIALIIIILILARQRVKAKNALLAQERLEHELEYKNKELTTNVLSLMKKNEMLSVISDKLVTIKNQAAKAETKEAINQISKEIQKISDKEILEEFELRFKQVHSDFYNKLLQRFPDLTPNEQRLCAFLRLNMSTKEISELTGQQVSTLETARYRLRKKLGITNSSTNLVTFLSRI
jgi:tetratricopeptide (TPR) repeat protein